MDAGDKAAIAILAASRCAALGKTTPADYVVAYAETETEFIKFRRDEADAAGKAHIATLRRIGSQL